MNTELLHRVIAYYEEEPKRLNMKVWVDSVQGKPYSPPCGTVSCIAGTIVILEGLPTPFNYTEAAERALGLHPKQGISLFHLYRWPRKFREAFQKASNPEEAFVVTKARIHHFIKTGS